MITNLNIRNFKSIKELNLNCKRVNLFIGEPNTGKSNILESIGIMSFPYANKLSDIIRFEKTANLFHKGSINEEISVISEEHHFSLSYKNNQFLGQYSHRDLNIEGEGYFLKAEIIQGLDKANSLIPKSRTNEIFPIKFYIFKSNYKYDKPELDFLLPPFGENLFSILYTRPEVYTFASDLFKNYGYKILLRTEVNEIEILIEDPKLIAFPYTITSDTLQRIVFYFAILETNKDSTILLEEPEAHVFPFYNKFLAERIALYNTNQFFIATHNPTFLANIIEQTPDEDLKVFVTYYENYQTKVFELSGNRLLKAYKIFGTEIFGNLEKIVKNLDKIIEKEELETN